ncbi:MAG: DNA adenine methylase [Polyangiaceae bacterium]|nr:DNA adenine methylase [Polyangiaceae bacterium]
MAAVAQKTLQNTSEQPALRASPVAGPWQPSALQIFPEPVSLPTQRPAKPFVKWVGGKRKLVPNLLRLIPKQFGNYFEPFVGGGALFYAILPQRAFLSDANERLVRAYRGVRDNVEGVIQRLRGYPNDPEFFRQMRKENIDAACDADVAAWLIYLNKTGFNGLYRVNRKNEFNVPFGDQENPAICDCANLRACSQVLKLATIEHDDFTSVLQKAAKGDLVYFDPPYIPLSVSSSFVGYTKVGFDLDDHRRLRDTALALKQRGVHVIISNSAHPFVRDLYEESFSIEDVLAPRAINCCGDRRGPVKELVIH